MQKLLPWLGMASVGGPMLFSNIYAYSNLLHDNPIYFTSIGMHN
jgi:hypothetical protein